MTIDYSKKEDQCSWKGHRGAPGALVLFSELPDGKKVMLCERHMKEHLEPDAPKVPKVKPSPSEESSIEVVPTAKRQEIEAKQNELTELLANAQVLPVDSQSDLDLVGEILVYVKGISKEIESKKRKIVDPLNASLKAVRDFFRPAESACFEIERVLKSKVSEYSVRLEQARISARAQIDDAATSQEITASLEAMAASVPAEMPEGVSVREIWDFEVVNALDVPREYLCVDTTFVRQAIVTGGVREIPGIKIFKKQSVAVKA